MVFLWIPLLLEHGSGRGGHSYTIWILNSWLLTPTDAAALRPSANLLPTWTQNKRTAGLRTWRLPTRMGSHPSPARWSFCAVCRLTGLQSSPPVHVLWPNHGWNTPDSPGRRTPSPPRTLFTASHLRNHISRAPLCSAFSPPLPWYFNIQFPRFPPPQPPPCRP